MSSTRIAPNCIQVAAYRHQSQRDPQLRPMWMEAKLIMLKRLLTLSCALLVLSGCGGSSAPNPSNPPDNFAPSGEFGGSLLRSASGAPTGIRLTWTSLTGDISGYHIYKSTLPISDSARGNSNLWVSVGGETFIPQAGTPGDPISIDDLFPVVVGETWYYRLSAIDINGEESRLSPEEAVDIVPFSITGLNTSAVHIGETFGVIGQFFGQFDAAGDTIEVSGVEWQDGVGFVPVMIVAPIVSWNPQLIEATLPAGATSGPVHVTSNGLAADSPDVLTNADPYIESLSPITADFTVEVTAAGNNFGAAQDGTHNLMMAGAELTGGNYVSYSNTQIVFKPENLGDYRQHPILVRADGIDSNVGYLNLVNAPPVAYLIVMPDSGQDPMAAGIRPAILQGGFFVYSYDPEGTPLVEYRYDFTSDGVDDVVVADSADQMYIYTPAGDYTTTMTVVDSDGIEATATYDVHVTVGRVMMWDLGTSPVGGDIYPNPAGLTIDYHIEGGVPPYDLSWYLADESVPPTQTLIATENIAAAGDYSHNFAIDIRQTAPVPGSNTLPRGRWRITCTPVDGSPTNDPDMGNGWPFAGAPPLYNVTGWPVAVLNDSEGDPGLSEVDTIIGALRGIGYPAALLRNQALTPDDLAKFTAVIVPADGPHGVANSPYSWLSSADLTLLMGGVDLGVSLIVLGPPSHSLAGGPFTASDTFNSTYQPFAACTAVQQVADFVPLDFTSNMFFPINSVSYNGAFGDGTRAALVNGGTAQLQFTGASGAVPVAAVCNGPTAGNVYIGMFTYSDVTGVLPAPFQSTELLDNIVSGTILNRP